MAQTLPMTVQDIMDQVYVAVDDDPTSSTDSSQDEWVSRLRLINMGIGVWESQDVTWDELWATYIHGSTVSAATTYAITATDMRKPASLMKFTLSSVDQYLEVVKPEEGLKYALSGTKAVYFTGDPNTGYTINLTWTPVSGDGIFGSTISFNYYKAAKKMALTGDKPEMSDCSFLVDFVSFRKNLYNGRSNIAQDYDNQSQQKMDNMKIRNEMRVFGANQKLEDIDIIHDNAFFGG